MDSIDRIFEALRGRPDLVMKLKQRLSETVVCGPWTLYENGRPGHREYHRRSLSRFQDIVARVRQDEQNPGKWAYAIHRQLPDQTYHRDRGFNTPEEAEAEVDILLIRDLGMILAPDGSNVVYVA